jgi:hypothetical protein
MLCLDIDILIISLHKDLFKVKSEVQNIQTKKEIYFQQVPIPEPQSIFNMALSQQVFPTSQY